MPHRMPVAVQLELTGGEQLPERRQLLPQSFVFASEVSDRHRRHSAAASPDNQVHIVDRVLGAAPAQQPARALRDQEIDQHRGDEQGDPARQSDQLKASWVIGQDEADEGQQRKCHGEHGFVNRGIGAPMLRRHQLGGDRKRRRDRKAEKEAGYQPQDEQLLETMREQDQKRAQGTENDPDLHHRHAADPIGHPRRRKAADDDEESGPGGQRANRVGIHMQRSLGEHQQRAGQCQIVALDKADKAEHQDYDDVIGAERDAIQLQPENVAGRSRNAGEGVYRHRVFLHCGGATALVWSGAALRASN